jgi:acetyl-CoA decarbonylase/synthase complex subunit gamma
MAGNEVVLFRHEKKFFYRPGIFVRVRGDQSADAIRDLVSTASAYEVDYVGIDLHVDGFAITDCNGDPDAFVAAIKATTAVVEKPLILVSNDPGVIGAGLSAVEGQVPLIHSATAENLQEMAALATKYGASLVLSAPSLDELASMTEQAVKAGVEDLVLDPSVRDFGEWLTLSTQIRRLALKKNFRPLGYPLIAFPGEADDTAMEPLLAAQAIDKYAGFIVLDEFDPALLYPLLVLRENIYTDPQKPIQVQPGLYELNDPGPDAPLLVTTNFSITYFSVANEVEGSGLPAWLLVTDAEGMSVLTAWAAGKFDAERIAKDVKRFDVATRVNHKQVVIPGHVAVISGELEEELPGWDVRVGPREAVDLPAFLKTAL